MKPDKPDQTHTKKNHNCLYLKVYIDMEIKSLWPNNMHKLQEILLHILKLSKTAEVNHSFKSGSVPRH